MDIAKLTYLFDQAINDRSKNTGYESPLADLAVYAVEESDHPYRLMKCIALVGRVREGWGNVCSKADNSTLTRRILESRGVSVNPKQGKRSNADFLASYGK